MIKRSTADYNSKQTSRKFMKTGRRSRGCAIGGGTSNFGSLSGWKRSREASRPPPSFSSSSSFFSCLPYSQRGLTEGVTKESARPASLLWRWCHRCRPMERGSKAPMGDDGPKPGRWKFIARIQGGCVGSADSWRKMNKGEYE